MTLDYFRGEKKPLAGMMIEKNYQSVITVLFLENRNKDNISNTGIKTFFYLLPSETYFKGF